MKPRTRMAGQLVVRVDDALVTRLDAHVAYLAETYDMNVSRAEVARSAIEMGMRELEARGVPGATKRKAPAPSQKGGVKRPLKKAVRRKG